MCDSSISVRPKVATRSTTNVWLIGHPIPVLDNSHFNQLPTVKEVLCHLFYDLKTNKLTLSVSLSNVIDELYQLWQIAHIPTTQKPNAVAKLRKFYLKYVSICKSKSRRSNHQIELERIFVEQLKMLFDISHADSQHLIKIPQDWEFLQDQLTARNMIMAGEDKIFKWKEELKQKRKSEEHQRCEKAKKIASSEEKITVNFDECTSTSSSTSTNESDEPVISKYHQQQVIKSVNEFNIDAIAGPSGICKSAKSVSKRQVLDNPMFISSLDRTKTTSREAMHIVAPALKAVGVDIDDITLSAASIHRSRKTVRKSIVDSTKQVFSPNTLVCHFDSKLLPDHDGTITDRLPVVVSGFQVEKLLGIPKIPTGTGIQMANAIIQLLTNWEGVNECVAGLCSDTTSVNTGVHTGAITVIQKSFNKHLLFLACRHHFLELLATAVFDKFFTSSAPQITLFSRFKDYWPFLDQSNYAPIDKDTLNCVLTNEEKNWLDLKRQDIVEFLCT